MTCHGDGVIRSPNDQGRGSDEGNGAPRVGIANRGETSRQALRIRGSHHLPEWVACLRIVPKRHLREPVANEHIGEKRHAAGIARLSDQVVPLGSRSQIGRCVGQDEAVYAPGCMHPQPLADEPSERQSAEMGPADLEMVQQLEDVTSKAIHRVCAWRNIGPSVSPHVVAYNMEVSGKFLDLGIPHVVGRRDRVREDKRRILRVAIEAIRNPAIVAGREMSSFCHY